MAKKSKPSKKLDPIQIRLLEKPVKSGEVLTVIVDGDYPSRYNEAAAIGKAAEQLMKDFKPAMLPDALDRIFDHNTEKPSEPITSVAFQDDKHNVTRISFTGKYGETTAQLAEQLFDGLKTKDGTAADVNNYLARTVIAEFDSTIFQNQEGRFDDERYDKIVAALEKVCKELDVKNPLSTSVVVKPLPSFHTQRWADFDKPTNLKLSRELQNQITFTPCPNAKTGLMAGEEIKD